MADTTPGTRSWYVDDYADEWMPCEATLEGWAAYLGGNGMQKGTTPADYNDLTSFERFPHMDGESFKGSAILWSPDIIARRVNGRWTLSRPTEPGEDFFAVRYGEGKGWDADGIIWLSGNADLCTELAELVDKDDDDEQFIAAGRNESGWRITFHAGPPPTCTADRSN